MTIFGFRSNIVFFFCLLFASCLSARGRMEALGKQAVTQTDSECAKVESTMIANQKSEHDFLLAQINDMRVMDSLYVEGMKAIKHDNKWYRRLWRRIK